jgi:hypothetical protein
MSIQQTTGGVAVPLTVLIPQILREQLKDASYTHRLSMSRIVREALTAFLTQTARQGKVPRAEMAYCPVCHVPVTRSQYGQHVVASHRSKEEQQAQNAKARLDSDSDQAL